VCAEIFQNRGDCMKEGTRNRDKVPAGAKRSSKWPAVRKAFLAENPTCAVCGGTKKLNVHHERTFFDHPELELNKLNLITLCEAKNDGVSCHLLFGHCGNFKDVNPDVRADAAIWAAKIKNRAR
jgi:5-methylcytosine-specific restriction enzyme A